jgi:hypothetical protein
VHLAYWRIDLSSSKVHRGSSRGRIIKSTLNVPSLLSRSHSLGLRRGRIWPKTGRALIGVVSVKIQGPKQDQEICLSLRRKKIPNCGTSREQMHLTTSRSLPLRVDQQKNRSARCDKCFVLAIAPDEATLSSHNPDSAFDDIYFQRSLRRVLCLTKNLDHVEIIVCRCAS